MENGVSASSSWTYTFHDLEQRGLFCPDKRLLAMVATAFVKDIIKWDFHVSMKNHVI